jgi:hypothetical protein
VRELAREVRDRDGYLVRPQAPQARGECLALREARARPCDRCGGGGDVGEQHPAILVQPYDPTVLVRAAVVAVAAVVVAAPSAAVPRNDFLLVLDVRAGPYRYLGAGSYAAAVAALGPPTQARATANVCRVSWRRAGITVSFATAPPPCSARGLREAAWYGMTLHGRRWRNTRGLRVGDSVAKVRRLYPGARFERRVPGRLWLVLVRRRRDELDLARLAVAVERGRVAAIEVPAGYVF